MALSPQCKGSSLEGSAEEPGLLPGTSGCWFSREEPGQSSAWGVPCARGSQVTVLKWNLGLVFTLEVLLQLLFLWD